MTETAKVPQRTPGGHMLHGSAWMISLRWAIRLTGLVSTIILARLLTPADFGIVAMAMIVVGMLEVLNQTGQKLALIRIENPTDDHYNSAWTISALIGFGIGIAIFLIAPLTTAYFHEPRAIVVMQCLGLRAFVGGLENIGTVDFRRELRFDRFFRYNVYPKLASFVVTVTLAIWLRNYWALVAGILTGQFTLTALSYIMHPYRPRPSLKKVSEIWSFSIWTFFKTLGSYLNARIDQIAIGGVVGAASMGRYTVASDVASSPSQEVNDPMLAVLFPVMSRYQDDLPQMRALYLRTLSWSAIICISSSVGITLVAPEFVRLVLGPQWIDVVPLMGWLALSAGVLGLASSAYVLFDATGKPHIGARMQWLRVIVLAAVVAPVAFLTQSLVEVAAARFFVSCLVAPTLFLVAGSLIGLSVWHYINALWRPFTAAAAMAGTVLLLDSALPLAGNLKLAFNVVSGAVVFTSSLLLLWQLSGRPQSPELDIVTFLYARLKKPVPSPVPSPLPPGS